MHTWKAIVPAVLLITAVAAAQQVTPAQTAKPGAEQSVASESAPSPAPAATQPATQAAPVTMAQVVDRTIQREHDLMDFLRTRTPLVETYLQNLKYDPVLGNVPKDDRYFLGRLDLARTVRRRDYLAHKERLQERVRETFTEPFKLEYKPLGFSWMTLRTWSRLSWSCWCIRSSTGRN